MTPVYQEREHAADIFVEIRAPDLAGLYEHGLYALYRNLVELEGIRLREEMSLTAEGQDSAGTLRGLVAEALYRFYTEGFVAGVAKVTEAQPIRARAVLVGERLDPERHGLLSEIKAVTYHRLCAEELPRGGWQATVIFDV